MSWIRLGMVLWIGVSAPAGPVRAAEPRPGPGPVRDEECLVCHAGIGEEEAPKLDLPLYRSSSHGTEGCVGCHPAVEDPEIDHEKKDEDLPPPDCNTCHDEALEKLESSVHRDPESPQPENGDIEQPKCSSCHGRHDIFPTVDPRARTHPVHQLETCGGCHEDATRASGHRLEIPREYEAVVRSGDAMMVQRLMNEGELVAAGCSDCHGAHGVRPASHPDSRLHPTRIDSTCRKCHSNEVEAFQTSVHARAARKQGFQWGSPNERGTAEADDQPPVCSTCHPVHAISRPSDESFRRDIVDECGTCHLDLMMTYRDSFHGKATVHGNVSAAICSDCHGYHATLEPTDPESSVAPENRHETCRECHPGAPPRFATFMPHADPRDADAYPWLFAMLVSITLLIAAVFGFFGLHTMLWALRDTVDAIRERRLRPSYSGKGVPIRRFNRSDRVLHGVLMVSFVGLAATGAPLRYASAAWAEAALSFVGGPATTGLLHRLFGATLLMGFSAHLAVVLTRIWPRIVSGAFLRMVMGPESIVPRPTDLIDVFAHLRHFLGLGPRPRFDRWTYWEKFDYWAIFWAIIVLGISGIILWFPEVSTHFVPGWMINFASLVHSDEALLTMGFVFGVHFFHSSLRRCKFPMDESIFTGSVPLEEYKMERGREWARIARAGEIRSREGARRSRIFIIWSYLFGATMSLIGLVVLGFSIHGLLTNS